MLQKNYFSTIERKAYQSTFQDGILDIFFGLIMLSLSAASFLESVGIQRPFSIFLLVLPSVAFFYLGKKYITVPRLGFVTFNEQRRSTLKKSKKIVSIFVVLTLFLLLAIIFDKMPEGWSNPLGDIVGPFIIEMLILTLPLCVLAYFWDFTRLYFIALLYGITWPLAELISNSSRIQIDGSVALTLSGGIVLIMGLYYFTTFLINHPSSNDEAADE